MTLRKTFAAAAAVSLLLGLSAAEAAKPKPKKPVCNLIKDAKGDATGTGTPAAGPYEATLDILSADVASNAKTLTVVFRVASVNDSGTTSPAGRAYEIGFVARNASIQLRTLVGPGGTMWANGDGTGKIDQAKNTITVHVPIAKLAVAFKPNDKLTDFRVSASRWVGTAPVTLGLVDNAVGTTPYVASWPSCVKVGG